MKNQFTLEIKKPCAEKFQDFTKTASGGFCGSCQKEVIDFTGMSSSEIISYFSNYQSKKTCGRFTDYQLTSYFNNPNPKKNSFLRGLGLTFLSLFAFNSLQAQQTQTPIEITENKLQKKTIVTSGKTFKVKGVVSDETGPLHGTHVLLEGTTISTETDFDGYFEFPRHLKKGDVLIFSFVGMNTQKITLKNENDSSKVDIKVNIDSLGCNFLGEVSVKRIFKSKKKFWKK